MERKTPPMDELLAMITSPSMCFSAITMLVFFFGKIGAEHVTAFLNTYHAATPPEAIPRYSASVDLDTAIRQFAVILPDWFKRRRTQKKGLE
jgi:hypothetical protein